MKITETNIEQLMSEQVLPSEVSLQSDTWLNRYRNFPVFSRNWFRHRSIAFGCIFLGIFLIVFAMAMFRDSTLAWFITWSIPALVIILGLSTIGQFVAVWVRAQKYSERKEAILIGYALALGFILSISLGVATHYVANHIFYEPQKIKAVPASAQNSQKIAISSILKSEKIVDVESEIATIQKTNTAEKIIAINPINALSWISIALMLIYLGSFFDFIVFFRQRNRLREVMRQKALQSEQQARKEAEIRLSVLVAQIEPHFLFNTLAGVRSAILTEPVRATAIVDHLVEYLRSTIPQMRGDGSTEQGRLAKQLDAVRAYLNLMQARIPRLSFSVESALKDAPFPPLLLISLVENAVKHGVEPKIGPAHISVHAHMVLQGGEEKIEVAVIDDGVGFGGTSSGTGIGLANIRERLESMFGHRANLTLKARSEGGVIASIVLPMAG